MNKNFRTVWLLAGINAIAMCAVPMMMLIGSIIGTELAPAKQWATLPIAMMVIGTACGVIPAAQGMQRFGRRNTFAFFILNGAGACALLGHALALQSFSLFCLGAGLLGVTVAALQQIRFAAMECVLLAQGPTAASIIMCAGIIAAFIGPELALLGKPLSTVDYQGSFWLAAGCLLLAGCFLPLYVPTHQPGAKAISGGRPLKVLLQNPTMMLAIVSALCAFMVMSFIMTATPISMHLHHGHTLEDAKWVIQSHITAMFLPSLITPWLFRLVGIRGLMCAGLACYGITIIVGLSDTSVIGFWGQLVMLGVGWNFLFVSGTALLPSTYREGEQFKVQALNDTVVFSSQAVASLSAGWAINSVSWHALLLICLMPIALMLALLIWQRSKARGSKHTI
jgi:MFS family permease